jgi:alkylation response protein AidB-like acyl-CoA dehydrogenase
VIAVQFGGLERLFELFRGQMSAARSPADGLQLARLGEAATELETARLWVAQAASMAERDDGDPLAIDAYVDLARGAFGRAAQGVMDKVQQGLGLRALIAPNPIERVLRDLMTYLRQPALDMSLQSAAKFILDGHRLPIVGDAVAPFRSPA